SCPPGDYERYTDPKFHAGVYTECNTWRSAVLARIAAIKPGLVVVAGQEHSTRGVEPDGGGVRRTVARLSASGARVAYLEDVPGHGYTDIPDCLATHSSDIRKCAPTRAEAGLGASQRTVEAKVARAAGATVVDATPWFCTSARCPVVIDRIIAFGDNSHL